MVAERDDPGPAPPERTPPRGTGKRRARLFLLYSALALQAVSALVFVGELWSEILGLRTTPIPFAYRELIQVLASLGLVIGVIAGAALLSRSQRRMAQLDRQVDVAAGNYEGHLRSMFEAWQLSPSEQAVAVYAMKGFSNGEIAELRKTSASTVKSQMNAIYRKTGLQNRQQLISFLVEDLLAGVSMDRP